MSPAEIAAAQAELESAIRAWRARTSAPPPRRRLPRPRRHETPAAYNARLWNHSKAELQFSDAKKVISYAQRCLVALREGREPASANLVVGIADASPTLGILFGRCLRALGVGAARFDKCSFVRQFLPKGAEKPTPGLSSTARSPNALIDFPGSSEHGPSDDREA